MLSNTSHSCQGHAVEFLYFGSGMQCYPWLYLLYLCSKGKLRILEVNLRTKTLFSNLVDDQMSFVIKKRSEMLHVLGIFQLIFQLAVKVCVGCCWFGLFFSLVLQTRRSTIQCAEPVSALLVGSRDLLCDYLCWSYTGIAFMFRACGCL